MQTTRSAPEKQAEYDKMANAPVGGLILSLAVPTMVTTLIMSVYNMADTFFVGRIGTSATAAVGVVFSCFFSGHRYIIQFRSFTA